MDTKLTKKYLTRYAGLKMEVENQLERIARAKNNTEIPAMRPSDGSQHQPGGSDRLGSAVIKWLDIEERLYPIINAKVAKMREIEDAINSLDDSLESEVLRLRYIDGEHCRLMPWKDIAMKLYGDDDEKHQQATFRLHGRALQSVGKVIEKYEINEVVL